MEHQRPADISTVSWLVAVDEEEGEAAAGESEAVVALARKQLCRRLLLLQWATGAFIPAATPLTGGPARPAWAHASVGVRPAAKRGVGRRVAGNDVWARWYSAPVTGGVGSNGTGRHVGVWPMERRVRWVVIS